MATDKTIDLDTLEEVDVPTDPKDEKTEGSSEEKETEEKEEEEEESEEGDDKDDESKEEKSEEGDDKSDDEKGDEESDESEEGDEDDEKDENPEDVDAVLKEALADYEIENLDDLKEILETSEAIAEELDAVKKENEELKSKPSEPVFKSEGQKKIYDFIKDYDPDKIADGIQTYATLVSMDLSKGDPKLMLEQQFLMEHPEISTDKARKKFQRIYESKYVVDRDAFEGTDEEFEAKKEDAEMDLEIDSKKAQKFLKEKQVEFKAKSEDKPEESSTISKEVTAKIEQTSKEFFDHLEETDRLIFQLDDDKEDDAFNYVFQKDELKHIREVGTAFLKNPANYDKDGKLIGGFDPESLFQRFAFMFFAPKMIEESLKSAQTRAQIIKAEQIAKKQPSRKAKSGGETKIKSIDDQFEELANKL